MKNLSWSYVQLREKGQKVVCKKEDFGIYNQAKKENEILEKFQLDRMPKKVEYFEGKHNINGSLIIKEYIEGKHYNFE